MKIKLLVISFLGFIFSQGSAQISLNEYCCSNLATSLDNYTEYNDWIELANTSAISLNIGGYYLSDDVKDPRKWKIPSGAIIPANGYKVIWADGRNEFAGGYLHASFKLTQSKKNPDWILLSDASGNLLERVQIRRHQKGHSIGKVSSNWQIFTTPTPEAINNGVYKVAYAASPIFSKTPGFYAASFRVFLTNPEPNSRIYYTTDGTDPLAGGTQYNSSGILIDSTKIIKAVTYSFNTSILPSFFTFGTFFININHTLPVISIAGTDLNTLANGNQSFRPDGSFEFFDKNKVLIETAYGNFNSHGQDSWANDQRSLDYKTRDEMGYNDAIHVKLFALSERNDFQGIILRAAGDDNYPAAHHSSNAGSAHIRDAYVQNMAIQGKLDVDARTGEKAIVYLNGKYWGVYDMRERADEQDYTKFYYNQDKYHLQYIETWGNTWAQYGGNQALTDWSAIRSFVMNNNMADSANYALVVANIDLKSLVDYAIVNSVSVCTDWLNYNTGWWRGTDPKGGHKKWGYTLWDNDAVFGFYINYTGVPSNAYTALPCNIESSSLSDPEGHIDLLMKLRQNPAFNQFYISRYIDLFNTTFSSTNMLYNLDSIINLLDPEMTKHANRWFGTYSEWNTNATTLRNYVSNRCSVLSSGLNTCYNLSGPYATTFKTVPAGSGQIQVNSLAFANLPYTGNYHGKIDVLLKAIPTKDFVFDYWTAGIDTFKTSAALADAKIRIAGVDTIVAHFTPRTSLPKINFTEINYAPEATWNTGSWAELTNYGSTSIDISGWKIVQGTWREYIFPQGSTMAAGDHWILASDSIRFNAIYAGNSFTKKYLPFDLSTNNEAFTLLDAAGTEFLYVRYDNKQPWPIAADGAGRNMELINDTLNAGIASNWRNGCVGGSPGASFQNCNEKIIVTEINYNSGQVIDAGTWFELLNTTSQSINLSGYSIRNKDFENRFLIGSGTIAANGRMVVCNDIAKYSKFFPTQNVISLPLLGLANNGDEIKLYNPADTLVFSVVFDDTLAFTKQANGTGYTLDYNNTTNDYSNGINWEIGCIGGSPNGTKGNCTTGILFTEINYKSAPFNDAGDWFEIKNKSNVSYHMKGWQFTDSTSGGFVIANDYVLAPNAYLVIAADTLKFKKMYPHVPNVLGNLNFNLSSLGERIIIYDSLGAHISLIDYNDSLPWPSYIDNRGYTMELRYDTSDFHLGNKWFRGCLGGSPGQAYTTCSDSIIISEYNFSSHPKADAGDWVELWNKGNASVNISNWLFQDNDLKDTFLIPNNTILNAGERLVIVNDSTKFKNIFPNVKNFVGNFSFGLSSVADQLVLRDTNSKLRFGMGYTIDSTWDVLASGQGYTLELIKDSFDRSVSKYWASKCPAGSPGKALGTCFESLVLTEINYKSDVLFNTGDWFEVMNNSNIPVNLSSHYLANKDSSQKAVTPLAPALLFANEYMLFANDTNAINKYYPGIKNKMVLPYVLRDTGDAINLYDKNKNPLLKVAFSAQGNWPLMAAGKGFTLESKNYSGNASDPNNWEIGCFGGSPGIAKQNCKINTVISEINYNPKGTENDGSWMEIRNVSLTDTLNLQSMSVYTKSLGIKNTLNSAIRLAPNQYCVIATDSIKFNTIQTAPSRIIYVPGFRISTIADEVGLYDAIDRKLYMASYAASEPGLEASNGKGYTINYIDTSKAFYTTNNWTLGCRHGSPGFAPGNCKTPLLISEINYKSHPSFDMGSWIEIKNQGNYSIDLSGWQLKTTTNTYTIGNGLLLKPNQYFIAGSKLQLLKNQYNFSNVITDSLALVLSANETISIFTNDSIKIAESSYSNGANHATADANGYTLEYSDTATFQYINGCPGGSPGTALQPCAGAIEITEINYNSHQKNKSNDWIEIKSKSNIPVALSNYDLGIENNRSRISNDKFYLVFNGERKVIARSMSDFTKLHSGSNAIEYSALILPDTQATLRIYNIENTLIDSVSYGKGSGWTTDAFNTGRTLEYLGGDRNNPSNWVAGCLSGSPAFAYTSPCTYPVLFSEINFHPVSDFNGGVWLELHNPTSSPKDISNMTIKSNQSSVTIPTPTTLAANGYLVLVQNKSLFSALFPSVTNILEVPGLQLSNRDKVEIYNLEGNILHYVSYDTLSPWPTQTVLGYTLEYADTAHDPWNAQNWFRGCFAGTPGRGYSLPCGINGINEKPEAISFEVYPNPNQGSFNLWSSMEGTISIYNVDGQLIESKTIDLGTTHFDLQLSKGIYFITLRHEEQIMHKKVVIQ